MAVTQTRFKSRSDLLPREWNAILQTQMEQLTPEEREVLLSCLDNEDTLVDFIGDAMQDEYERVPVCIEDWLTEYYLGESVKSLYPKWKEDLILLFSSKIYETAMILGSLGSGKSEFASIALLRMVYEASCLKDPAVSYGLASGSRISFCNLAKTEQVAKAATFDKLLSKIQQSEYFNNDFPVLNRMKDNKSYKGNEISFGKGLSLVCGSSSDSSILGANVMGGFVDELNFFQKTNKNAKPDARYGVYGNAGKLFDQLKRRIKSRFQRFGRLPGLLIGASSKTSMDSLTEKFVREAMQSNDSSMFVRDYSILDVKPDAFSKNKFKVLVGNAIHSSKILDNGEEILYPEDEIVEVPEEFRKDFEIDIQASLRDLLGVSTTAIHTFISKVEKLQKMKDETRFHPFSCPLYADSAQWDSRLPYTIAWDKLCRQRENGEWEPLLNPWAKRYAAFDPGLTGDAFAVCFLANTKILMADMTEKDIQEVKTGDYVIDAFGDIQQVTQTFERKYCGEILNIKATGGVEVNCTPEHPFLAKKKFKITSGKMLIKPDCDKRPFYELRDYNPDWINAEKIEKGDFVCLPKINLAHISEGVKNNSYIGEFKLNKEFGMICGYYLAEGSFFAKKNHVDRLLTQFTFGWNALDKKHIDNLKSCLESFGITEFYEIKRHKDPRTKDITGQSSICLRVMNANLARALYILCGRYSGEKKVNANFIWAAPEEFLSGLVTAYLEGDGTINSIRRKVNNKEAGSGSCLSLATKSKYLALLLEILCRRKGVGISRHLKFQKYSYKGKKSLKPIWRLSINSFDSLEKILLPNTIENIIKPKKKRGCHTFNYDKWVYHRVGRVSKSEFQGYVYNFETTGSHSYVAERIGVHNCIGHVAGLIPVKRQDNTQEFTEYLPYFVVDFVLRIKGEPGEEVLFRNIRRLIYEFSCHGYHIAKITMDKFQSRDGLQTLKEQGYNAEILSVDEEKDAYLNLRRVIYDERIKCYNYEPLWEELVTLEEGATKIDHHADGKKDCADALCAVVYALTCDATYSEPVLPVRGELKEPDKPEERITTEHDENFMKIKQSDGIVTDNKVMYKKRENTPLKPAYVKISHEGTKTDLLNKEEQMASYILNDILM